jgi:hypothetical protein
MYTNSLIQGRYQNVAIASVWYIMKQFYNQASNCGLICIIENVANFSFNKKKKEKKKEENVANFWPRGGRGFFVVFFFWFYSFFLYIYIYIGIFVLLK